MNFTSLFFTSVFPPHTSHTIAHTMPPARHPMGDITKFFTNSKKRAREDDTDEIPAATGEKTDLRNTPAPTGQKTESRSNGELRLIDASAAAAAITRLTDGYTDKSGSGYGPTIRTSSGCLLAQKGVNRTDNGYVQIAPLSFGSRAGTTNGTRATKPLPQGAHRLAVIADGTEEERAHLLDNGWHASHRCHQPRCIARDHIVVESKDSNEKRKRCAHDFWMAEMEVDREVRTFRSTFRCSCSPTCVPRRLEGEVV
jgi:hypothetical protein